MRLPEIGGRTTYLATERAKRGDCERRLTAQRPQGRALSTLPAAGCDGTPLRWGATTAPLGSEAIGGGGLVARMGALTQLPTVGNAPLADAPVPQGVSQHRVAPRRGKQMVAGKRLSHASAVSSTPHRPVPGHPSPTHVSLSHRDFRYRENAISYAMHKLAALAMGTLRRKLPELALALTGQFTEHHGRLIHGELEVRELLEQPIATLDEQIRQATEVFEPQLEQLQSIPGIKSITARDIIAEIGVDMRRFGSAKRLSSWGDVAGQQRECGQTAEGTHTQRQSISAAGVGAVCLGGTEDVDI